MEQYCIVFKNNGQTVGKCNVSQDFLSTIPHLKNLIGRQFVENIKREIVVDVPGLTRRACMQYMQFRRYMRIRNSWEIKEWDPYCLALAEYLGDDVLLNGDWVEEFEITVRISKYWRYSFPNFKPVNFLIPADFHNNASLEAAVREELSEQNFEYYDTNGYLEYITDGPVSIYRQNEARADIKKRYLLDLPEQFDQQLPGKVAADVCEYYLSDFLQKNATKNCFRKLAIYAKSPVPAPQIWKHNSLLICQLVGIRKKSQPKAASFKNLNDLYVYADSLAKLHESDYSGIDLNDAVLLQIQQRIQQLSKKLKQPASLLRLCIDESLDYQRRYRAEILEKIEQENINYDNRCQQLLKRQIGTRVISHRYYV